MGECTMLVSNVGLGWAGGEWWVGRWVGRWVGQTFTIVVYDFVCRVC